MGVVVIYDVEQLLCHIGLGVRIKLQAVGVKQLRGPGEQIFAFTDLVRLGTNYTSRAMPHSTKLVAVRHLALRDQQKVANLKVDRLHMRASIVQPDGCCSTPGLALSDLLMHPIYLPRHSFYPCGSLGVYEV